MPRRELNNENVVKRMTETFGYSDNLITLSQALAYTREVTTPFILRAGRPRQYTAFLGEIQGRLHFFSVNELITTNIL
jgi:hypothetical protein